MFRGTFLSCGAVAVALVILSTPARAQVAPPGAAGAGAAPAPPPGEAPGAPPPPPAAAGEAAPGAPPADAQPAPAPAPPPPPPPAPPAAPPPNAPTIFVEQPPPPPPAGPRGRHRHDGFYLRMSLGIGGISGDRKYDTSAIPNSKLTGGGGAFDLMMGGSPSPGFVVGGGLLWNGSSEAEIETAAGTTDVSHDTAASLIGVFIDGFPDPEGGFHVGGMLGGANYVVAGDDDESFDENTAGLGAAVWLGYGGFIASEWTLGGMLRLTASATRREFEHSDGSDVVEEVGVGTFSIMFTALYH